MFKKFINMLKQRQSSGYDPSVLNDPVATNTEWFPAKGGGTNFRTHKLVQTDMNRYEFKATMFSIIFAGIFFTAGIGVSAGFLFASSNSSNPPQGFAVIFPVLFGLVFALIGFLLYWFGSTPRRFDKNTGYYWKGRSEPNIMVKYQGKDFVKLSEIYAIQLISEWVRSNKSSYTSYELNLVMKDSSRLNVIDHGSLKWIRQDAAVLADFLGVPVWDAINR